MKSKLLSIIICLLLLFSITACGSNQAHDDDTENKKVGTDTKTHNQDGRVGNVGFSISGDYPKVDDAETNDAVKNNNMEEFEDVQIYRSDYTFISINCIENSFSSIDEYIGITESTPIKTVNVVGVVGKILKSEKDKDGYTMAELCFIKDDYLYSFSVIDIAETPEDDVERILDTIYVK